ncbi:MAG: DUF5714 domain-containing protein [Emergencia sp.]
MKIELKQEILDSIMEECLQLYREGKMVPVDQALMRLMDLPGIPMHYPYHHYIMPAALLTLAAVAAGEKEEALREQLKTAMERAVTVPGGFCGNCGTCGAAVGCGIFFSVYTGAAPKKRDNWNLSNEITGRCLLKISSLPGPRCCKRTLFLSAQEAADFISEKLGLPLTVSEEIRCRYHQKNAECLETECPFYREEKED